MTYALVADFGIARAIEAAGDSKLTETGWCIGTPAYMSPEQAAGDEADGRSDIYRLGCVVYEMLAGHSPFQADNARAMFTRHQLEAPTPIGAERPEVPEHIQDAVHTALAKLPVDRFATASEFRERLSLPGPRRAPAPAASARARPGRRSVAVALASAVLIGGAWLFLRGGAGWAGGGRPASVAVLPIEDLGGDTVRRTSRTG